MRVVLLDKVSDEVDLKSLFEEQLGLRLEFSQTKVGHAAEVVLGATQHHLGTSGCRRHDAVIVASDEAEVCQHSRLAIVCQVVTAGVELIECYARPVLT